MRRFPEPNFSRRAAKTQSEPEIVAAPLSWGVAFGQRRHLF